MAVSKNVVPDPHPNRSDKFAFECPRPGCGFVSYGWPTKTAAQERGDQHENEHATGEHTPELAASGIKGAVAVAPEGN